MTTLPKRGADWEDRLEPLEYTSPTGTAIRAYYERTSSEEDARGTVWDFPGVDGVFVQRTGMGGRKFPLTMIFAGPDCDHRADQFEAALREPGYGKLQTPLYGKHTVVPLGTITRTDDLTNGMNQSLVDVTLWKTLTDLFPRQKTDAVGAVQVALLDYSDQSGKYLAKALKVDTVPRALRTVNAFQAGLQALKRALAKVSRLNAGVQSSFSSKVGFLDSTLTTLVGNPLLLASQIVSVTQLPGTIAGNLAAKFAGYKNMIDDILGLDSSSEPKSRIPAESENNFAASSLMMSAAVTGMVLSTTTTTFKSRSEALKAAVELSEKYQEVLDWRESRAEELDLIDDADAHAALQSCVDAALDLLIESSFSLPTQRIITLDKNRGLIELCAELYGSVDEATLDNFISSNRFTGNEILELPEGRKVVHYV